MTNQTTTRSRLECFILELETEIEKWKSETDYWREQFAKAQLEKENERTERERQRNLLMTVLQADQTVGCQPG